MSSASREAYVQGRIAHEKLPNQPDMVTLTGSAAISEPTEGMQPQDMTAGLAKEGTAAAADPMLMHQAQTILDAVLVSDFSAIPNMTSVPLHTYQDHPPTEACHIVEACICILSLKLLHQSLPMQPTWLYGSIRIRINGSEGAWVTGALSRIGSCIQPGLDRCCASPCWLVIIFVIYAGVRVLRVE